MLSLLAPLLLPLPPQTSPAAHLRRYDGSLRAITLDLDTGTLAHGPRPSSRAATTVAEFRNLDLAGFVGVDSGGGACQWICGGVKGASNASDLMSEIVFAYCSGALTPRSGGPGGSVQLGFYEGYTVGGPAPTTSVLLLNLTGLPGRTGSCTFFGAPFRCFYLTVTFSDLVAFADGAIGYSWTFLDFADCTGAPLAATFPFLACVQSCSGLGPDGQGMVDRIDKYCPPGTLVSSFSFGTTASGSYFSSMTMEIREAGDLVATATSWNGAGVNADALSSDAIVVGRPWTATVTIQDDHGPGPAPMSLRVRSGCVDGTTAASPIGGRPVQLLIQGALALQITGSHGPLGTTATFPAVQVPGSPDLVGVPWAAQAVVLGGGFADLTSARCGVVGTVD